MQEDFKTGSCLRYRHSTRLPSLTAPKSPSAPLAGFTIVELLIVIVVIGILAAVSIVVFSGIQNRAKVAAAQSASTQASKKLQGYAVENNDLYPADLASIGIVNTADTSYQYSVNNSTTPKTYCVTTTTQNTSYYQNNTTQTTPAVGGCPGHGVGGVAAITNLVKNPKGVGVGSSVSESSGWFTTSTNSDTSGVSWNARNDWHRFNGTTANRRLYLDLSTLENTQVYTVSMLVGNDSASVRSFGLDFCDQGATTIVVQAGEMKRVSISAARSTYDSTYRFVDVGMIASSDGILITEAMVTKSPTLYTYADGSSPNWIWNGTANNSTSTGPPL
ncbi:MAG: type II secretion system protein [Candidatus Microsaccharimonas sp.]